MKKWKIVYMDGRVTELVLEAHTFDVLKSGVGVFCNEFGNVLHSTPCDSVIVMQVLNESSTITYPTATTNSTNIEE